jgi:hypothetical protein
MKNLHVFREDWWASPVWFVDIDKEYADLSKIKKECREISKNQRLDQNIFFRGKALFIPFEQQSCNSKQDEGSISSTCLRAAFMHANPKSTKRQSSQTAFCAFRICVCKTCA